LGTSAFLTFNVCLISNANSGIFIRLAMNFLSYSFFSELSAYVSLSVNDILLS